MSEQKRTYEEAVEITVKWWCEKSFETPLNQNNGDDSEQGGLGFLLMNMLSSKAQSKTTPEMIEKFKSKLTEILLSKKGMPGIYGNQLDVDYHPNKILSDACKFSGIDESCLPIKTFTRIEQDNMVRGRYQYGGPWFEL